MTTPMRTQTKMLPYQEWVFEQICQFSQIKGNDVLEIGGVPNQSGIANNLIDLGAHRVLQINNRSDLPDQLDGSLQYCCKDARDLDFDNNQFDIVFSASVLEHLLNIDTVLDQLYNVTKPGGLVCLHGGAFWNCSLGHHVWVLIDGKRYAFNGDNPVPDWSHLYYDRFEMADYLHANNIPEAHVDKIVKWVYDSNEINRLTYDNLATAFNRSKFDVLALTPQNWIQPSTEMKEKLRSLHGDKISNYSIGAAVVVLKKPLEANGDSATPVTVTKQASQPVAPKIDTAQENTTATSIAAKPEPAPQPPHSDNDLQPKKEALYQSLLPIHGDRFENILEFFYTRLVQPGQSVVDIGAHIGRHMLPLARTVGDAGRVFAFEPIPRLHSQLENMIVERGLQNVIQLSNKAMSNEAGTATFQLIDDAPGLSGLKERTSHAGHDIKEIQVQVQRLDDAIPESEVISFLKIDAEGADFYILNGARRILTQNRPVVGFESGRINAFPAKSYNYGEAEFNAFFESIDYVLYDIVGLKYETHFWNRPTLNDLIAIPSEKEQSTREYLQLAMLCEFAAIKDNVKK